MHNWLFVLSLAFFLAPLFLWSFKELPRERWQILCAIPVRKKADGSWQGLNLTYYGLFNALALCAAVSMVFILTASAGIDFPVFVALTCLLLGICLPASRLIARWVEKKPNTFSVGAASFLGIVMGPWLVLAMESMTARILGIGFDPMAVMAALMIGYALGEGIGRLACISFGCCYGKPMDQMPSWVQRYFRWAAFSYSGCTKKIAYAHHLDGMRVFAIPAVTALLYCVCALTGTLLYLYGMPAWAFFLCLFVTQLWRFFSEFLRSDYRGDRKISIYQIMSLATVPYGLLIPFLFPVAGQPADAMAGLRLLWNPAAILFLQIAGILMFLRTGRSQVTGSGLSFFVKKDQI